MGASTTSSTTDRTVWTRAGRGRGVLLTALTAVLFSLSAGAAAASPVEAPPSPQHLHVEVPVPQDGIDQACAALAEAPSPAVPGGLADVVCQNVNGWQ